MSFLISLDKQSSIVYDLENPESRIALRDDLEQYGFFKDNGNGMYYPLFESPTIKKEQFFSLVKAIRFFMTNKLKIKNVVD